MQVSVRSARVSDVRSIINLIEPYVNQRILLAKELITYFEDISDFVVAEDADGIVGCGALHVFWDDLGEVRTLAVAPQVLRSGVGSRILRELLVRARTLGLQRVFCLTFEVDFFSKFGFQKIEGTPVGEDTYREMVRSRDDGVAEFLELAATKPNTLGNTRMLLDLNSREPQV